MPKLDKKSLSQYFRSDCERQLKLNLYSTAERKNLSMPPKAKARGNVGLVTKAGNEWEEAKQKELEQTFGTQRLIGNKGAGGNRYTDIDLRTALQQAGPDTIILQGKYEVGQTFIQRLNLGGIVDFNQAPLDFADLIPDLVQVLAPGTLPFTHHVDSEGFLHTIAPGDKRLRLRLVDIKRTEDPSAGYFGETVYYAMALAGWLVDEGLDGDYIVVSDTAVWPGSHDDSSLSVQHQVWVKQNITPTSQQLFVALEDDLEVTPFESFAPRIRRFLQERVPAVLQKPGWTSHPYHVTSTCMMCDFLGFPWTQNGTPQNHPDHCWPTADTSGHLSRVPYLTRGSTEALHDGQVVDVTALSTLNGTEPVFEDHQELRAQRAIVPARARAFQTQQAQIPPYTGTSAVMPRFASLSIYVTADFDVTSALTFAFGISAFWYEPLPYGSPLQSKTQPWKPQAFVVETDNLACEEKRLLEFLGHLDSILRWVRSTDDKDQRSGRRTEASTLQIYLIDDLTRKHLMRAVGRHLDAILANGGLKYLAWLWPPEELMPDPDMATRQSPLTLISDVVRAHVAAPIPHHYALLETVKHYHPAGQSQWVPSVHPLYHDPLSDQIPSERAHAVWSKGTGYAQNMADTVETVKKKLKALEMVTRRLRDELDKTLSNQAAPQIDIKPPTLRGRIAPDGQLLYAFSKLDAALQSLETSEVCAMPPHEREARFRSARMQQRLAGRHARRELQRLGLQPKKGRLVFRLRSGSKEVKFRPGEFNVALSPEQDGDFLDRSWYAVAQQLGLPIQPWDMRKRLADMMKVTVTAVDREQGYVVLDVSDEVYGRMVRMTRRRYARFDRFAIIDPVFTDYFTDKKLKPTLKAIGFPSIAPTGPLVQRALGQQNVTNNRPSPHTPAADVLWDAQALHATPVPRAVQKIKQHLISKGFTLNPSQWKAWENALTRRLQLIWGPPGTGKSRVLRAVILGAVLDAFDEEVPLRILVCSATYRAVDNVILDTYQDLPGWLPAQAYEFHRLRSTYQPPDGNVPQAIDRPLNAFNPSQEVLDLRERLLDRDGITIVGATPEQVFNLAVVGPGGKPESSKLHKHVIQDLFDLIIIDEASQMNVAQSTLPLATLADEGAVVLAGDDLQLPPINQATPPEGLEAIVGSAYSYFAGRHGIVPDDLQVNYRSGQVLVDAFRHAGYDPALQPHSPGLRLHLDPAQPLPTSKPANWPSHLHWTPDWSTILNPDQPAVCFVYPDTRSSQYNAFEADAVAALLYLLEGRLMNRLQNDNIPSKKPTGLYTPQEFWEKAVGVVTPHKAQMGRIIDRLHATMNRSGLQPNTIRDAVDTVERFQGQQRDVIIASFALGDPDAIRQEDEFLFSLNRFNVMASRARAKLIVLASQSVVDYLSNDIEILRESRLLKYYVDLFCQHAQPMQLGFLDKGSVQHRNGLFRYH